MIEETVGRLRVSTCLYIFHLSHFSDPVRVTLEFLPFLNEDWTNSIICMKERGADHGHENPHPIVYSAFQHVKRNHADQIRCIENNLYIKITGSQLVSTSNSPNRQTSETITQV